MGDGSFSFIRACFQFAVEPRTSIAAGLWLGKALTQAGELVNGDIRPLLTVQASKRLGLGDIVASKQRDQWIGVNRFRLLHIAVARTTTTSKILMILSRFFWRL